MVKLRGQRIHLHEIESAVSSIDGVACSSVVFSTRLQLILAFVVTQETKHVIEQVLQNRLPGYKIPTLICIDKLPLTTGTGTVDQLKLQEIAEEEIGHRRWTTLHHPSTQSKGILDVTSCVQELLQTDQIPRLDLCFSELGLDSIILGMLHLKLKSRGHDVSMIQLLEAGSAAAVASILDSQCSTSTTVENRDSRNLLADYRFVDLQDFPDRASVKKMFFDAYWNRCPLISWLEDQTEDKVWIWNSSTVDLAYDSDKQKLSTVVLDKEGHLVAGLVILTDELIRKVKFHKEDKVFVASLTCVEKPVKEELKQEGVSYVQDFLVGTIPRKTALEEIQLVSLLEDEFNRRARVAGVEALVQLNVHPVTQAAANQSGYTLRRKLMMKNYEHEGRRYLTSSSVPDDFFVGAYVKYLD